MRHPVYDLLFYFASAYLIIAGIVYIVTLLIIFLDKQKRFFDHVARLSSNRSVQIITAILTPAVFALGWIFLFPFTSSQCRK